MWPEVHAPTCAEECAWSIQKLQEIVSLNLVSGSPSPISKARQRKQHAVESSMEVSTQSRPFCVLMYGGSGCGKLATLKALYPAAFVAEGNLKLCNVHFAVEHSLDELSCFLNHAIATATASHDNGHQIFVVKGLPHWPSASQTLSQFIDSLSLVSVSNPATCPTMIFLHTIHDTHSEKADLRRTYPGHLLDSKVVRMFHCTAITVRNAEKRLRQVADKEKVLHALGPGTLTTIAESCGGDIRHSLLQLQWHCLLVPRLPVRTQPAPAPLQHHQNAASTVEVSSLSATLAKDTLSKLPPTKPVKAPRGKKGKTKPSDAEVSAHTAAFLCDLDDEDKQPKSNQIASQRNKRSRASSYSQSITVVEDEIEDVVSTDSDVVCTGSSPAKHSAPPPKASQPRRKGIFDEDDDEKPAVLPPALPPRDEYIGVGHATARFLCQKYTAEEVVAHLTVPPHRIVNYIAQSMYMYFMPHQLAQLAECSKAVAKFDDATSSSTYGGSVGNAGLLQVQGTATMAIFTGTVPVETVALSVLGAAYRLCHKEVHSPRTFASMTPLAPVVPWFSHVLPPSVRLTEDDTDEPARWQTTQHVLHCGAPIGACCYGGAEVAGHVAELRAAMFPALSMYSTASDDCVLDLVPYARLLALPNKSYYSPPIAAPVALISKPKRTPFSVVLAAQKQLLEEPRKVPLTHIQWKILCERHIRSNHNNSAVNSFAPPGDSPFEIQASKKVATGADVDPIEDADF